MFWGTHDPSGPGVAQSYPFKLWSLLRTTYTAQTINVYNGGLGGERVATSGARARFLDAVRTYQPQLVLLMHGANDLIALTDRGVILGAMEELIGDAQARGAAVMLATLPRQVAGRGKQVEPERVVRYNEDLIRMAAEEGAILIDVFPHIREDMIGPDGLHLTQAGNQRIAELFYAAIAARYQTTGSAR